MSPPFRVLVVGGGSAGWITAAYLDAVLNGLGKARARNVVISLVESRSIGRIGVGEATIPSIRDTLGRIGISEADVLKATEATFKHGIRFCDWNGPGHAYFHPFDRRQNGRFDITGVGWMQSDRSIPFADIVSVQPRLALAGLAPKTPNAGNYEGELNYAYHLNAEALADLLQRVAVERGVEHIEGKVTNVGLRGQSGHVDHVTLEDGRKIGADLFIDCSGFAAILIDKTLNVRFRDDSRWLPCDRAVTMQVPLSEGESPLPYTTATAMPAGWRWDIGLRSRRGTGYVYSSAYCSDDDAENHLRQINGHRDLPVRKLQFPVGRREQAWVGNVVAIGLSAGFIEPLESTGLFLVEKAVLLLSEHFPFGGASGAGPLRDRFNALMGREFDELLPFVALHYIQATRADTPFWIDARNPDRYPDRLRELMQLWERKPPSQSDFEFWDTCFHAENYEYILYGLGWRPSALTPSTGQHPPQQVAVVERAFETLQQRLPTHLACLNDMHTSGQ